MARIIYKDGCEGQNRLECIEEIEIDLLNGQKALIYPKYSNEKLLDPKDRDRWLDAGISETAALRLRDNQAATAALLEAKSPAARFVTKFTSERFGRFGLPTLLAAMEITEQRARRVFGVPQRTRLRVLNRGHRFYHSVWYLRSRGYEVDARNLVAYYDDGTRRCPVLEKKGRNPDKGHYFDFREKKV